MLNSIEMETIAIHGLASSGEGVGRLSSGQVVFVPLSVPGDVMEIAVVEKKKGYARGELVQLVQPSPQRVTAECELAASGRCGGCPWMQADRGAQMVAKQDLVVRAMRHINTQVLPVLAPAAGVGYRMRVRFRKRFGVLGLQASRSHEVTSIDHCPVLVPALDKAMAQVRIVLEPVLQESDTVSGLVGWGNQVHIAVETSESHFVMEAMKTLLHKGIIAGGVIDEESIGTNQVNIGTPEKPLWSAANAFAQASMPGHTLLPMLVAEEVGWDPQGNPWGCLVELYAGSGNLTRFLQNQTQELWAVESNPNGAKHLLELRPAVARVECQSAEKAMKIFIKERRPMDVIVLDPPREGAKDVLPFFIQVQPARIVYVSCDAMTLARDLLVLQESGFVVKKVQPIDLMPHTPHVEMIAILERGQP